MNKKLIIFIILISLLIAGGIFWWQSQSKEPKTYKEVFEELIDPNLEPEKHKEVYEKVQKIVHFSVMYPKEIPEGYKLVEVDSTEGEKTEEGYYYGMNKITYEKGDNRIEIWEGYADLGTLEYLEKVTLKNGDGWFWRPQTFEEIVPKRKQLSLTFYPKEISESFYGYEIIGIGDVLKEDLIEVANSLVKIK